MDRKDYAISNGNEDFIRTLTRGHSCYIVAKSLSTFGPCYKTSWEAECKEVRQINLMEEISRQSSIQAVIWLLLNSKFTGRTVNRNQSEKA
jgi:hypothetical protein